MGWAEWRLRQISIKDVTSVIWAEQKLNMSNKQRPQPGQKHDLWKQFSGAANMLIFLYWTGGLHVHPFAKLTPNNQPLEIILWETQTLVHTHILLKYNDSQRHCMKICKYPKIKFSTQAFHWRHVMGNQSSSSSCIKLSIILCPQTEGSETRQTVSR